MLLPLHGNFYGVTDALTCNVLLVPPPNCVNASDGRITNLTLCYI